MQKQQLCFGRTVLFLAATVKFGNSGPASMKTRALGAIAAY
jgi:hypothetical protein